VCHNLYRRANVLGLTDTIRAAVKGKIKTLDMTVSMIKCTIRKYNEQVVIDIETRSMTSYHLTHTATPAGNISTKEHCRVANAYDQLNCIEQMIEIVPKDSSESAQWMAKRKTVVDRIAQRKVIYSTSMRDQVINRSTTKVNIK
jgi:hypothetical protein